MPASDYQGSLFWLLIPICTLKKTKFKNINKY